MSDIHPQKLHNKLSGANTVGNQQQNGVVYVCAKPCVFAILLPVHKSFSSTPTVAAAAEVAFGGGNTIK